MNALTSTSLPLVSTTFALLSTNASALERATSPIIAGSWLFCCSTWMNSPGSMPYWADGLHEVGGELVLADLDLFGLGDRVEQDLRAERLLARLGDLGAVRVVLEAVLALEVAVHLVVDQLLRNRDLDLLEQLVDDLVARLHALAELLRLAELLAQVGAQLADRVELAGDLGEVVVGRRKLALLDAEHGHGDLGVLALVVAAEQRRLERGGLAGGQGVERVVDAVDQLAGAELVGDVRWPCRPLRRRWWRPGRG